MKPDSSQDDLISFYNNVLQNRFLKIHEARENKVVSLDKAIEQNISPGMSIHILGLHYRSHAAIYELYRQFKDKAPEFEILAGTIHGPVMSLFHAGMVKKAVTAFTGEAYPTMGPNPVYSRLFREESVKFESWSFLTFTLRLLAGAMNLGFLPTRSFLATDMLKANSKDCCPMDNPFDSKDKMVALRALNPDITLLHGHAADRFGNTILLPPRGEDVYGAIGSKKGVVVTVEKIVSPEYIREYSHLVKLPGNYVKSVSQVPMGAHPSGLNAKGLKDIQGYGEDIPFYIEARKAAKNSEDFDQWVNKWILGCKDHEKYLSRLSQKRIDILKNKAVSGAWQNDIKNKIDIIIDRPELVTPVERAVLASSDILREKAEKSGSKLILSGAGLASLASWIAIYGLKEKNLDTELISELGFHGFSPRPGEPFLFNLSNIPTCKGLDGILTMLGIMIPGKNNKSIGALSSAQIDRFGNLNTSVIREHKILMVGSGGANDVLSSANDVVVIIPQSKDRFLDKIDFITSAGARVKTLVSTLGIFEKLNNEDEFTLTYYFDDSKDTPLEKIIKNIQSHCGWTIKAADKLNRFPDPDPKDLATLRMFDPDRYFLKN